MSENPLLNPLKKLPGISITLPTKAILYTDEVTPTVKESGGEIHIRPMSSRDEMIMRTSDLILNGQAFKHVCKNCVEGINEPLELYQADHDAILVGLRIATYGDIFPIKIPNQAYDPEDEESEKLLEFDLDLRGVLQNGRSLGELSDYQIKIASTEQVVTLQPLRVKHAVNLIHVQLEERAKQEAKKALEAEAEGINSLAAKEREALSALRRSFDRTADEVSDIQDEFLLNSIRDVDGHTDRNNILEWYSQLDAKEFYPLKDGMEKFTELGIQQTMTVKDPRSDHEWETAIPLNPFDFFVSGPAGVTYPE